MSNQLLKNNVCFRDILKENTKDYKGNHKEIIKNAYPIYMLCVSLLNDAEIEQEIRFNLFTSIGYFVIPNDYYSEREHGPIGYIEDLLICLHVLRIVKNDHGIEKLAGYWEGDIRELGEILDKNFKRAIVEYDELYSKVLEYTGVWQGEIE